MVSAIGHISGGHINPAVTIAFLVTRRIPPLTGALYIVAQIVGASLAAIFLAIIFPQEQWQAVSLGTPMVANITVGAAFAVEAVLTFFLVLVIFGTAVDPMGPKGIAGFGIGCVVILDIFMGGPLTGAAMNPARAFGPALISGSWQDHITLYWAGPIVGALVAASLYHFVLRSDSDA
jgi:MIP family channel proteins